MKTAVFIFSVLMLLNTACNKKENAGFGGNANLKLIAKHHGLLIDSCTFYIKFNATDAPSDGVYDVTQNSIKYSAGNSYGTVSGLKKGNYYIYGIGWDPSIASQVSGGIPYTITDETAQDVIVAVTEVH